MARTLDRCGGLKAVAFSLSASWFIFLFFCAVFAHVLFGYVRYSNIEVSLNSTPLTPSRFKETHK